MKIRPISTDAEHRAALEEIERLWNAPEGSDDHDKLGILSTLVEKFEERRWPVEKLHALRAEIDKGIASLDTGQSTESGVADFLRQKNL